MKFQTLVSVTLISTVLAVDATVGDNCKTNGDKDCVTAATTLCCGTATKDASQANNNAGVDVTVCNTKTATTYVSSADSTFKYTFKCDNGSSTLYLSTLATVLIAYMMI